MKYSAEEIEATAGTDDAAMQASIQSQPGLLWKAKNVKARAAGAAQEDA